MLELNAGVVGTLSVLAVPLTVGLLAFAALGAQAAAQGLPAALLALTVGGAVFALCSRAVMPAAGPASATALILAALVTRLATAPEPLPLPLIVALAGAAVSLSGLLQIGLALAGLARLARFVPQPVLAGFMNGVAVLIVVAQLPQLAGAALGQTGVFQPGALVLGLATAAVVWCIALRWPRAPAALIALAAGTLVHVAARQLWPALDLGATVGTLPHLLPWPDTLAPLFDARRGAILQQHGLAVLATAAVLATIGALESALNRLAVDLQRNARHDPRRELIALGCANLVGGAFGALPTVLVRARANATLQSGGRRPLAPLLGSVVLALLLLLPPTTQLLAALPLAVLAGLMLTVATALVDQGTRRLVAQWWAGERSRDLLLSLGVMLLVALATVAFGFVVAVALGVLLSLVVFIERMNRSLLRARYDGVALPSRRVYSIAAEERLAPLRARIEVIELEGALFFGSAERLVAETETLPATCSSLVLDLHRVRTIDESGAVVLQQIAARLQARGVTLRLAGLPEASAQARLLRAFGVAEALWPDADRAIEAAERDLLGSEPGAGDSVALADCALMQGLDDVQLAWLTPQLARIDLNAGAAVFEQGDPGDRLFVITRGSVSVLSPPSASGRTQRYLSMSAGMTLGETALLDGGGRTAGAVADTEATLYALTRETLAHIGAVQPHVAAQLQHNLALHLSQRLRAAAAAWHAGLR